MHHSVDVRRRLWRVWSGSLSFHTILPQMSHAHGETSPEVLTQVQKVLYEKFRSVLCTDFKISGNHGRVLQSSSDGFTAGYTASSCLSDLSSKPGQYLTNFCFSLWNICNRQTNFYVGLSLNQTFLWGFCIILYNIIIRNNQYIIEHII